MSPSALRDASHDFRPDIEGLRGLAVLLVVCFHGGLAWFSGGFIGVDVFFVLSGYLITGLLVAEFQRTSRIDLVRFYGRRAKRLLPAFALMLTVTLGVAAVIYGPDELLSTARAGRSAAVYLSNVFFGREAADYFAAGVKTNPFLHTWSLAVEEQFYLFWPLLVWMGLRGRGSTTPLVWLLTVVSLASLGVCLWTTANTQTFAFYQLPARAWEFGLGGVAQLLSARLRLLPRVAWRAVVLAGLAIVVGSASLIPEGPRFPGALALFPVCGTCLALMGGAALSREGGLRLIAAGPLPALGALSYSWYLWHWPFLVFAAALFPTIGVGGKLLAVGLSLGCAAAGYVLVENPIRYSRTFTIHPGRAIAMAAGIAVCTVGLSTSVVRYSGQLAQVPVLQRIVAVARADISRIPRQRCTQATPSSAVITCNFGDTSSAIRVVLFGDSHAMQWFNSLEDISNLEHWELTTVVKSGCPVPSIDVPDQPPRVVQACNTWRRGAFARIPILRAALVVVASSGGYLEVTGRMNHGTGVTLDQWRSGAAASLAALSPSAAEILWVRDPPMPQGDVPTCVERSLRHGWYPGGDCAMPRADVLFPAAFEAVRAAARGLPNVSFVDLSDVLCGDTSCPVVRMGVLMYKDDSHLTGAFADSLARELETPLVAAIAVGEQHSRNRRTGMRNP